MADPHSSMNNPQGAYPGQPSQPGGPYPQDPYQQGQFQQGQFQQDPYQQGQFQQGQFQQDPYQQGPNPGQPQMPGGPAPVVVPLPFWRRPLFWSLALAVLATLAFAWLLVQKWNAEKALAAAQEEELAALKAKNAEREAYLAKLREVLALDPCDVARGLSTVQPPSGSNLPVLPAPARPDDGGPAPAPQTQAPQTPVQPGQSQPAQSQQNPASVAELMQQATVLILVPLPSGLSMGTGFFIAKDCIVTNCHVVKNAPQAIIINKKIGQARQATVVVRLEQQGLDFAVLKCDPMPVQPLKLRTDKVAITAKVSAWGYPGTLTTADPKFNKLIKGQADAAPDVIFAEGSVNVVLDRKPPIVVHSAVTSHGNSGGPLVNEAGEVVGVNTQIQLDKQSYRQSSFAIASPALCAFLKANGVPFTEAGSK